MMGWYIRVIHSLMYFNKNDPESPRIIAVDAIVLSMEKYLVGRVVTRGRET
jgi:hypothetical protein